MLTLLLGFFFTQMSEYEEGEAHHDIRDAFAFTLAQPLGGIRLLQFFPDALLELGFLRSERGVLSLYSMRTSVTKFKFVLCHHLRRAIVG